MNTDKNIDLIVSNPIGFYLQMAILPLIILGIDLISSLQSRVTIDGIIPLFSLGLFLLFTIIGFRLVKINNNSIKFYSALGIKTISLSDIAHIKTNVIRKTAPVAISGLGIYFTDSNNNPLGSLNAGNFSNNNLVLIINKIISQKHEVDFNKKIGLITEGNFNDIGKKVNNENFTNLYILGLLSILVVGILGLIYLFGDFK